MIINKKNITEEVEKTLTLMDSKEIIEPNPFLYTKVKAAIDESEQPMRSGLFPTGFKLIRVTLLILLFTFNLYSVVTFLQDNNDTTASREQYLDSIRTEYSITSGVYTVADSGGNK